MQDVLNAVSVVDFKSFFFRDFKYLSTWDETTSYLTGQKVFYQADNQIYLATAPSQNQAPSIVNYILDMDIKKALISTKERVNFNLTT
jgi:hypothetical protein